VSGSLQSLFLVGSVVINPGDAVYLENPTFPNVISIFKSLEADVRPYKSFTNGTDLPPHSAADPAPVKLVHITPSNFYPLGGKLSKEGRLNLLQWAADHKALIIENDYEHEINNWHAHEESIYTLDTTQRTIYLGTFNRILHPSIRLGYMVLPPYLLPAVKALQMHSHRFVSQSTQVVMTEFLDKYHIYKHLRKAIEEAEDRKAHFLTNTTKWGQGLAHIDKSDVASFHLVARLDAGQSDTAMTTALAAKGVIVHPLSKCYFDAPTEQGLIIGHACVNKSMATDALTRMAKVLKEKH
jgi:GntR family transcriptional regulator/MocR family aminotransferase